MKILIEMSAHEAQIGVETGLLQALADAMKEETAKVMKQTAPALPKESAPEPEPEVTPEPEEAPQETAREYTLEEVRAALGKLIDAGKKAEVAGLIKQFGARNITSLPAEKYPDLMAEAAKL